MILSPEQLDVVLQSTESIGDLNSADILQILEIIVSGFSLQRKILLTFMSAQVPAALTYALVRTRKRQCPWVLKAVFGTPTPLRPDIAPELPSSKPPIYLLIPTPIST